MHPSTHLTAAARADVHALARSRANGARRASTTTTTTTRTNIAAVARRFTGV